MPSSLGEPSTEAEASLIVSPVDVFSRNGDLAVTAELPGKDPERDIDIEVREQTLTIRSERRMDERIERGHYYRMEAAYGRFQRSLPLPEGVKPDDIKASYENGVLEVVVPKGGGDKRATEGPDRSEVVRTTGPSRPGRTPSINETRTDCSASCRRLVSACSARPRSNGIAS